jgi:hypothetical protein
MVLIDATHEDGQVYSNTITVHFLLKCGGLLCNSMLAFNTVALAVEFYLFCPQW